MFTQEEIAFMNHVLNGITLKASDPSCAAISEAVRSILGKLTAMNTSAATQTTEMTKTATDGIA